MQARESQINERQNTTTAIKNKVTHKAYFPIFLFIFFSLLQSLKDFMIYLLTFQQYNGNQNIIFLSKSLLLLWRLK